MPIDIRCTCGTLWRIEADAARGRCVCADCGRDLPRPSPAEGVPLVRLAPLPADPSLEIVQVKPFYEPDAPAKPEPGNYQVVETARVDPEPRPADRRAHEHRYRPMTNQAYEPYYAHPDFEEREFSRVVADARLEMWRYGLRRRRPLDRNVWDCFLFAGKAWWMILILGFGWLVLTPIILLALPTPQGLGPEMWLPRLFAVVVAIACVAATWTFLRDVHGMAAQGKRELQFRLLFDWRALTQSAWMAVAALLAGPILLIGAGVWFWIYSGAMTWLDALILAQLGLCACVAWVYLLFAADARARWRDIHVAAIVKLVREQGWPGWAFPLMGGISLALFGYCLVQLLALMLEQPLAAVFFQLLLWYAGLYFWTGLMRWYGITRYRRQQAPAT
jgi:hypothetical protein